MDQRERRVREANAEILRGYSDAVRRRHALEAAGSMWAYSWARACEQRWWCLLRQAVIYAECGGG